MHSFAFSYQRKSTFFVNVKIMILLRFREIKKPSNTYLEGFKIEALHH